MMQVMVPVRTPCTFLTILDTSHPFGTLQLDDTSDPLKRPVGSSFLEAPYLDGLAICFVEAQHDFTSVMILLHI
jgi:hypothetical protein